MATTASWSSATEIAWTDFPTRVLFISHCLIFFFFKDSISCSLGRPQNDYIAKEDDSDPLVLLQLPPGCWDHRHEPPQQVCVVLGSKPRLWACLANILTAESYVYTQDLAFVVENLSVVYASLGICYCVSRRAEEKWCWTWAPGWIRGSGHTEVSCAIFLLA